MMQKTRIVDYVKKNPGCTAYEIALLLDQKPSSVSSQLSKLERAKVVFAIVAKRNDRFVLTYREYGPEAPY